MMGDRVAIVSDGGAGTIARPSTWAVIGPFVSLAAADRAEVVSMRLQATDDLNPVLFQESQ